MINPLVSVIIPAYNADKLVTKTLDSVLAQTYRPIEIIVVDDGSTDETAEVVKNYEDNKLVNKADTDHKITQIYGAGVDLVYIRQKNRGPSKARNTGIKAAKGEYIAFLDADDYWTYDKLEKQIELFKKELNLDIVFTDTKITRRENHEIEEFFVFKKKGLNKDFFGHEFMVLKPFEKLVGTNFMHTSSVITKKACFRDAVFFNEKRHYAEDWELWLKMSLYFTFGYINDVCVHKIERGDGLSSNKLDMYLSTMDIMESFIEKNKNEINKLKLKDNFLSNYLKEQYKWMGYYLMQNKNNKMARIFLKKSLKEAFDMKTIFYYFFSYLRMS